MCQSRPRCARCSSYRSTAAETLYTKSCCCVVHTPVLTKSEFIPFYELRGRGAALLTDHVWICLSRGLLCRHWESVPCSLAVPSPDWPSRWNSNTVLLLPFIILHTIYLHSQLFFTFFTQFFTCVFFSLLRCKILDIINFLDLHHLSTVQKGKALGNAWSVRFTRR